MLNSICDVIRMERITKGLSQEEVAKKLGRSQSYYTKMEKGKAGITLRNLLKLLEIFEIDYFEFNKKVKKRFKGDPFYYV